MPANDQMRLAILFAAFFLGLLSGSTAPHHLPPWSQLAWLAASIIVFAFIRQSRTLALAATCFAFLVLGNVWASSLPSWPTPLKIKNIPLDAGCTVVGRSVGEAFESRNGRFLPISVELARPESRGGDHALVPEQWQTVRGIVLVRVPRDVVGIPGARYSVHGKLVSDPDRLRDAILLRYCPRAIIEPRRRRLEMETIDGPTVQAYMLSRLRYLLMSHLSWGLGDEESELVAGITFGRKGRRIGGNWAGDFYRSGLSHLIVASGAQVSLLFLPLFFLLGRVRLPAPVRLTLLTVLGVMLTGFAQLLGGEPSILRAAAMGCILLISVGLGRRTNGLATLSAAGFFWLLRNPLLVRDTGFLLSFGASFGIIYLSPMFFEKFSPREFLPRPPIHPVSLVMLAAWPIYWFRVFLRLLIDWTLITLTAQIGVFPVLACTVGRVSPVGFVANLFAVPVAQIILYLGALSGLGGFISPAISAGINRLLGSLAVATMAIAHDFASLPFANMTIDPLPAWIALVWYLGCILAVELWRNRAAPPVIRKRVKSKPPAPTAAGRLIDLDKPLPSEATC